MGKIPRKIDKEKVIGFVICDYGPLACGDKNDIVKLEALAQIYDKATARGAIIFDGEKIPGVNPQIITPQERKTYKIIASHASKNIDLLTAEKVQEIMRKAKRGRFLRLILGKRRRFLFTP